MKDKKTNVKTLVTAALLCAVAYVVMYISKMIFAPIVVGGFLTFDLKDVVIAIAGFMLGPLWSLAISLVVSLLEMVTRSDTGPIGMLMNVLSTVAFVCPAAVIYKKKHNLMGAILGLVVGALGMTGIMLLWNYLITPLYLKVPRDVVVGMLLPVFLPFNLIKAGMNGALTVLLYKPVITGLRRANLLPKPSGEGKKGKISLGILLLAALAVVTFILLALVLAGII